MTVRQLLANIDSRELSEWYVLCDMEFWQKRIAQKETAQTPDLDTVIRTLFAKAANQGGIKWQKRTAN